MSMWILNTICQIFKVHFIWLIQLFSDMCAAMNNCKTRHLVKILINLAWCLQECVSASDMESTALSKALNALFISSVFLKYLIENTRSDNFEELYLSLDETDPVPNNFSKGSTCYVCTDFYFFSSLMLLVSTTFLFVQSNYCFQIFGIFHIIAVFRCRKVDGVALND